VSAAEPPRAADWVVTIPFLLLFGLILLVFDPLQRLARLFGPRAHDPVAGALQWAIVAALRLCGVRIRVERDAAVRPRTPYVVISNHQSMFDIPLLGAALFSNYPKYVSKKDLARGIPSISYNIRRGGSAVIDRDDREQAVGEIRRLGERVVARGVAAVIFPEGTRARDGALKPFRPTGSVALLDAAPGVAVVPVAIDGSWRLTRRNLWPLPFGAPVRVRIGAPVPRSPGDSPAALVAMAEAWVRGTLTEWRGEAPPVAASAPADTMTG
jgi:1-acyl-sn-glycerol-3-phosphate acyltransferase